jgi:hypothetical protein
MSDRRVPCIYILDPIGVDGALEANGIVYYFCSERCMNIAANAIEHKTERQPYSTGEQPYSMGESSDWIPGTQCDECGQSLEQGVRR